MLFLQRFAGYQIAIAHSHHKTSTARGCEPLHPPIEKHGRAHKMVLLQLQHLRHTQLLMVGISCITDPSLPDGFYVEPTVFMQIWQDMTIANEEGFGPLLSVVKCSDE